MKFWGTRPWDWDKSIRFWSPQHPPFHGTIF